MRVNDNRLSFSSPFSRKTQRRSFLIKRCEKSETLCQINNDYSMLFSFCRITKLIITVNVVSGCELFCILLKHPAVNAFQNCTQMSPHCDCVGHSSPLPWLKMSMMSRRRNGSVELWSASYNHLLEIKPWALLDVASNALDWESNIYCQLHPCREYCKFSRSLQAETIK